jgi:hypothetical protein
MRSDFKNSHALILIYKINNEIFKIIRLKENFGQINNARIQLAEVSGDGFLDPCAVLCC